MWELICHHDYRWGAIAADRSPWRSDGVTSGVAEMAGEAGLRFSTRHSRVVIPRKQNDPWSTLRAISVSIVARYIEHSGGVLIDADQCFRLRFDGPNEIVIEILGQTLSFRFDGMPVGNWITIGFSHDGVNTLSHGHNYSLASGLGEGGGAGTFNVPGQVPAVGPEGVWIGSRIGAPEAHLKGNIASVKIWRLDPQTMIKTFLKRPFTPPLLECWVNFVRKLKDAARKDPECAEWLAGAVEQMQNEVFQRLAQKSPETVAEFRKMCEAYQKLWAAGKVGSPEMQELVARLRDWLKSEGLFSGDDPDLRPILENPCIRNFVGAVGGLECDADAQTLIKAILGISDEQTAHA